MSDNGGVHDGAAQRKSEGGRTSRKVGPRRQDADAKVADAVVMAETDGYAERLRHGELGPQALAWFQELFPRGYATYKPTDRVNTIALIRRKVEAAERRKDAPVLTPEEIERQLYGPPERR